MFLRLTKRKQKKKINGSKTIKTVDPAQGQIVLEAFKDTGHAQFFSFKTTRTKV